jgi:formylglycine-generating enzyme required for sulfatase activity
VGDEGNAADKHDTAEYGAVAYAYRIGKFEVTAGQYTEFLNAVAKIDSYGLYQTNMSTNGQGCQITRGGSSGSYAYAVASDYANRPVNYVSWGDAARFANWLHNGQGNGSTETGAYNLNGATSDSALLALKRTDGAKWAIPTEDEWYKAAYYKGGSTNAGYWDYPTSNDNCPSYTLGDPDPGNNATYVYKPRSTSYYTIGSPYYRTTVGDHENSDSPYGTFDQGGNVSEWNQAIMSGSDRGRRGGDFTNYDTNLSAQNRYQDVPTYEDSFVGFRLVQLPEPASLTILALGGLAMIRRRR